MYWLFNQKSKLTLENKILLYKAILKPIWTYGIPIWGVSAKSNLDILQRFQSKTLRMCTNAPYFVSNDIIHRDLRVPTVYETIQQSSKSYRQRLANHPNPLASRLISNNMQHRRLRRFSAADLPNRVRNIN